MSAWVYDEGSDYGTIISLSDKDNATPYYRLINTNLGYPGAEARDDVGAGSSAIYEKDIRNAWHHVLGVFVSDDERRLYVDGEYRDTDTTNKIYNTAVDRFSIGRSGDSTDSDYFNGLIDEVKIFNYALTPEQIKTEYAGGAVRFGN